MTAACRGLKTKAIGQGQGLCMVSNDTQLAKFSGPTAANGRQYRQRHGASGPTLGRLDY